MLVLTRFKDESIIITTQEGRTEIVLIDVGRNGKVHLGIEAPKSVQVHRAEIQIKIDQENKTKKEKGVTNGTEPNLPG